MKHQVVKNPNQKNQNIPNAKEKSTQLITQEYEFSGPIPPPEVLIGYKSVDESFPDRIMKMAESDLKMRHRMSYLGWISTFSISVILIVGGIYLVANDKSLSGLIILGASVVIPLLQLLYQHKNKDK